MGKSWVRCLVGAVVMAAAVATPAAAGATWTATVLPVPSDVFGVRVNGTDRVDQVVGSFDTFD